MKRVLIAVGGETNLAKLLGFKTPARFARWRQGRVPAEYCPTLELLSKVLCEDLRPDVGWDVLLRRGAAEARAEAQEAFDSAERAL